jgi:predicted nucleic acid-binding protein
VTIYFLDSSALVKRYVNEQGSAWIQSIVSPDSGNTLVVARTTWVEVSSAFARLRREASLIQSDFDETMQSFRYDWNTQYQVIELDSELAQSATQQLFRYPLRAFDAIQLAACLKLKSAIAESSSTILRFVSADERLLAAATGELLMVDNPNHQVG